MSRPTGRFLLLAVGAFLLTRIVAIVGTYFVDDPDRTLMDLLGRRWDPRWYTDIAEFGYDDPESLGPTLRVACPDATPAGCLPGAPDRHSNLAFFPLFPAILRVLATAGMDPAVAAVIVAGVASVVAAAIISLIGRDVAGDRVGVIGVVLWGVLPANVVLSSGRPEPLFIALSAAALLLLMRRQVMAAAVFAAAAGLARFQAIAVVLPVMVAAWVWPMPVIRRLAATLVAPLGLLAYLAFVARRTGSVTGWFDIQREWGSTGDGGVSKWRYIAENISGQGPLVHQVAAWTILAAVVLLVACVVVRLPWPLTLYAGLLVAAAISQSDYHQHSMRYLIAAFPLVLPVAIGMRRMPTWLLAATLTMLAVLSATFQIHLWESSIDF